MKFHAIPLEGCEGQLLAHNVSDPSGRRVLRKGTALDASAVQRLIALGHDSVYVAEMEEGDVQENDAARRIAHVAAGPGVSVGRAHTGRVNLTSDTRGVIRVEAESLLHLNGIEGVTVATLPIHRAVKPSERVATVKVIPYAIPESAVALAERLSSRTGVVSIRVIEPRTVAIVLVGSQGARTGLAEGIGAAIRGRLGALGCRTFEPAFSPPHERELASILLKQLDESVDMIVMAGETAIMDTDDLIPRGLRLAGGRVEQLGLPMDPGHLLLLGSLGETPVVGAPGCVRGTASDGFDAVVPRLLAGERLVAADLQALGHGGLLSDPRRR